MAIGKVIGKIDEAGNIADENEKICGHFENFSVTKLRMAASYLFFFDTNLIQAHGKSLIKPPSIEQVQQQVPHQVKLLPHPVQQQPVQQLQQQQLEQQLQQVDLVLYNQTLNNQALNEEEENRKKLQIEKLKIGYNLGEKTEAEKLKIVEETLLSARSYFAAKQTPRALEQEKKENPDNPENFTGQNKMPDEIQEEQFRPKKEKKKGKYIRTSKHKPSWTEEDDFIISVDYRILGIALYYYTHPDPSTPQFLSFKPGDVFTFIPPEVELRGWKIAFSPQGEKGIVPGNFFRYLTREKELEKRNNADVQVQIIIIGTEKKEQKIVKQEKPEKIRKIGKFLGTIGRKVGTRKFR